MPPSTVRRPSGASSVFPWRPTHIELHSIWQGSPQRYVRAGGKDAWLQFGDLHFRGRRQRCLGPDEPTSAMSRLRLILAVLGAVGALLAGCERTPPPPH